MLRVLGAIERALDAVSATLVAVCLGAVTIQVVMRYGFNNATTWSDTMAAAALSWLAFLASTAAVRRDENLAVRFVVARLGPAARKAVMSFGHLAVLCFSLVLAYSGTELMALTSTTHVEGMVIDVSWADIYAISVISGALMALFSLERIAALWLLRDGR